MRKRLVVFLVLFFLVSISISYILSTVIFNLDSNSINSAGNISTSVPDNSSSSYILIFLFFALVYLIYHIFYIELAPWFKLRAMKKRENPLDLIEFLLTEIKKNEKKFPSKASALVSRLKHFYEYLSEEDKKEALKISELRKYINLKN